MICFNKNSSKNEVVIRTNSQETALNYNLDNLPTGLKFNSREVVVNDDGVLYIDSSVHNTCYESYASGGAAGQTGEFSITLFIEIYDAQDELLTTVTMGYSFQPTV